MNRSHPSPFVLAAVCAAFVAACATPAPDVPAPPAAPVPVPRAAAPTLPPPLVAAAFADAVARAGERLLQEAQAAVGGGARELAIDPLLDASTGQQTNATVLAAAQLAGLITRRVPAWNVQPLTRPTLTSKPLVLIGTLTAVHTRDVRNENADAFALCLALVDTRSGKLVARRTDRATLAGVDAEPTSLFRESPTWALDANARATIGACQDGAAGAAAPAAYLQRLPAEALLDEAALAFAENRLADAYRLFREARAGAGGDDLRVLGGLYITSWKTGRKKEAAEVFARIATLGLDAKRLPLKMFFNPGTTTLLQTADAQAQYAVWLNELATLIAARPGCVRVVGHTSRTGDAAANELLSQKRAAVIKSALERHNRKLAPRIEAEGAGSREIIVGLGSDDLRDALDRRVELRVVDCR